MEGPTLCGSELLPLHGVCKQNLELAEKGPDMVTHTYNPSYLGDGNQED
jgi:hypothetical protein